MLIKIANILFILLLTAGAKAHANGDSNQEAATLAQLVAGHAYQIQHDSSSLAFRVDSPLGDIWGNFREFKGEFVIQNQDEQDKTAEIQINADSLDSNAGFIKMMLKSESFFDVDKFPSIHFVGTSIDWYGKTRAILKGRMTIQKITHPIAFYVELVDTYGKGSNRITVSATTTIKRSQFGLYTLLPLVSDDVNIFMSVDAVRKDAVVTLNDAARHSVDALN